eukprot:gb/GECG01007796.1/.p1 GENE.gb/GECG01007796.1/~~gb/GECG01007796.1/.p1  ORF type:complete len:511 (+),score=58.13 gb/GECG01007796.1/:1-1533(+)
MVISPFSARCRWSHVPLIIVVIIALALPTSGETTDHAFAGVDTEGQQYTDRGSPTAPPRPKKKKLACGGSAQYTVPLSVQDDGICDCCNCADEPSIKAKLDRNSLEYGCKFVHETLNDWLELRAEAHYSGARINRKYQLNTAQAELKQAYFSDLASSAREAAHEYISQYRSMQQQLRERDVIQDAASAMQALQRSYFYAKEASLHYALMDALSNTNFGPNYKLMNFLFVNCTESEALSDKTIKGGSTTVIPKRYKFRFCPFYNATQVEVDPLAWKEEEEKSKGGEISQNKEGHPEAAENNLGYWLGQYETVRTTYTQSLHRAFHTLKDKSTKVGMNEPWDKWLHQIQHFFGQCLPTDLDDVSQAEEQDTAACFNRRKQHLLDAKQKNVDPLHIMGIDPFSPFEGNAEATNFSEVELGNALATERLGMVYENGESCGEGMLRSTRVRFVCDDGKMNYRGNSLSEETDSPLRLLDVREDGSCSYLYTVGTPFSCNLRTGKAIKSLLSQRRMK